MILEAILLFIAVLAAGFVRSAALSLQREHDRVRSVAAGGQHDDLTCYELAYLAGGPRRVADTALAVLAKAGGIRVSRGGLVNPVAGAPPSPDPIEQAVLDSLAARPGGREAGELRQEVASGHAMDGLRFRLVGMGLLVPGGSLALSRRLLDRLKAAATVAAVTEIALIVYITVGPPELNLLSGAAVLIAGGAAIGGIVTHSRQRRALRGVLSTAGREALLSVHRDHAAAMPAVAPGLAFAVGIPVALYGLGQLDDPELRAELAREEAHRQALGAGGDASAGDAALYGGSDFSGGHGDSGGGSCGHGDSGGGASCGGGGGCGGGGCGGGG